ncbi:hypothetical protein JRO89_XS03G0128600 [Xanthoceras sorbifolium]|uniref:C2H2-type domain-containing protein n=1 Tax=Xanthoceras sorbifolium TaxID=99658 RepID=A0ABQ8I9N8_9ROSI|nr:hypothetical protein JRO89_XS03G0128600 [Xanthoceras sorbifolium]
MHSSLDRESSHGVHVCSKCGWPYPKSHPSARQRRSHKKICGTIEGYKPVVDCQDTTAVSDEDQLSDEDKKTPSLKPAEKIDWEKRGCGGTSERSHKSEDEVFSDAVTEFNDTRFSPGTEERMEDARAAESNVEKIMARKITMFYSFKDNAIAALTPGDLDDLTITYYVGENWHLKEPKEEPMSIKDVDEINSRTLRVPRTEGKCGYDVEWNGELGMGIQLYNKWDSK